jgi:hypothetical protein
VLLNRVSWGAVLAGVVVALVVQLILNMIGVGVGAATLDPGAGAGKNPSAESFSIGAAIWWTVSGILAALAGGFAAGRLAGQPKESTAGWHGLTSWALTTLIVFWLLATTLGGLIGGGYSVLRDVAGGVASTTGGAVRTAAQAAAPSLAREGDPLGQVDQSMRNALSGNDPAAMREAAVAAVRAAATGDQAQAAEARNRAAEALAKAQNIPIDEARTQVQRYEEQYRQGVETAKRQATEAAAVASRTASRAALVAAVALLLGAIASWFGGRMGSVQPTITPRPA